MDELRREAARPLPTTLPLYSPRVVRSVDHELAQVAHLLRSQPGSAQGPALAQLLLSASSSPLYGDDAALSAYRFDDWCAELGLIPAGNSDGPPQ